MRCITGGFYLLKDRYFLDFPDKYLKQNKEETRPFYFCFKDEKTGLYWMIPLSSSLNKIALAQKKQQQGKTDIFHMTKIGGKQGVMLIADICPVTEEYVLSPYCIDGVPVVYKNETEIKTIVRKARKVLGLLRRGVRFTFTQPDILRIEKELQRKRAERKY